MITTVMDQKMIGLRIKFLAMFVVRTRIEMAIHARLTMNAIIMDGLRRVMTIITIVKLDLKATRNTLTMTNLRNVMLNPVGVSLRSLCTGLGHLLGHARLFDQIP
jgi:hypothetical protein